MRCLADFTLHSDMCLAEGVASLTVGGPDADFMLTLRNPERDKVPEDVALRAELVFDAESLDGVRRVAVEKLSHALSILSFSTNRKFAVMSLRRVIEWTPGIIERRAVIYAESPLWDAAEPTLDKRFTDTATRLLTMQSCEEQQQALRWYRLAIQADQPEEQFSYFWFALEIAAESLKETDKVPSKCPKCHGALYCEQCEEHPVHRRYAGEAIRDLVARVHPEDVEEVFETLQTIRHTLMHGRRIRSVAHKLPCTEEEAVNKLAWVTWQAIFLMFSRVDPEPEAEFNFGYVDSVVRRTIVASASVRTTMLRGDPEDPKLEDFPNFEYEIVRGDFVPHSRAEKDR